ncbi:MAG TPA: cytochrome-c peroxidase [Blastocatellia bacterium]|nr:cytochrome-c peroxidase [Blastocatellia bacterium]
MKRLSVISAILICLLGAGLWPRSQAKKTSTSRPVEVSADSPVNEPIQPIPLRLELDERKVALGEKLFHDKQLSHDNSISCAGCHNLKTGGVDLMAGSIGINGSAGSVNAPTVYNSGFNFRQFWNGRAAALEDQVDGPTHAPGEMGSSWAEIIGKLRQSPAYTRDFAASYPDGIQSANIKDAIAVYERSLYTPNSRFDRFLRGDSRALSDEEKEGYRIFKAYGCVRCHQGVNVGGNLYQKFGVMVDYLDRRNPAKNGEAPERPVFKVPSLRNVALTPPYFHDGSAERLEDAVRIMGVYQLGRQLSPGEVDRIVKFLKTLTGEYKGKQL